MTRAEMRPALERHMAAIEDFRGRAERLIAVGQARGVLDTVVSARSASIGFIALIDGMLARATLLPGEAGAVEGIGRDRGVSSGVAAGERLRCNFFTHRPDV